MPDTKKNTSYPRQKGYPRRKKIRLNDNAVERIPNVRHRQPKQDGAWMRQMAASFHLISSGFLSSLFLAAFFVTLTYLCFCLSAASFETPSYLCLCYCLLAASFVTPPYLCLCYCLSAASFVTPPYLCFVYLIFVLFM